LLRILIVEDEKSLLKGMTSIFEEEGYMVMTADNGADGLYLAEHNIFDLLVLDIMMPELDGISLLQALREQDIDVPVILLTAKESVQDRVIGLDSGADDYLVKPFASPELLARARVLLRRRGIMKRSGHVAYRDIELIPKSREGFVAGMPLKLSEKEFDLLEFFVMNHDQILTREQIFDRVWGFDSEANLGVVDLYVHYVRKKLAAADRGGYIQTLRGVGFIFGVE